MIWNRAHAELSYLQEIDKWKDKVMAEDTGIKAASKYHVNYSQGRIQNFGGSNSNPTHFLECRFVVKYQNRVHPCRNALTPTPQPVKLLSFWLFTKSCAIVTYHYVVSFVHVFTNLQYA